MRTCYYYLLVEPVRGEYRDSAESIPAWSVPITSDGKQYDFALFTDDSGLPTYTRLTIPGLQEDRVPDDLLPMITAIREHLIAALRFGYHPHVNIFSRAMWSFADDGEPHHVAFDITFGGTVGFDAEKTRVVFAAAFNHRQEIRLLVDAADERIPLQYRFLSAYKLLELEFKTRGDWRNAELDEFLAPFEARAHDVGIVRLLRNEVHALRDKCAHIRTARDTYGITQLNVTETREVDRAMPIIWDTARAIINRRANGTFTIERMPPNDNTVTAG